MAHDIVRVFDTLLRTGQISIGAAQARLFDSFVQRQYHVDTGMIVTGGITENATPGSNTSVALLSARTLSPVDVVRALGNSYLFRSVPVSVDGYFIMGIDLDGNYQPVCQGPVFPVAQ